MLNSLERACGMTLAALVLSMPLIISALVIYALIVIAFPSKSCAETYLGRVGSNPFCSDCTANEFAPINNPFNPRSPRNPFGRYGNPYSPYSANNPFATKTPKIYGE